MSPATTRAASASSTARSGLRRCARGHRRPVRYLGFQSALHALGRHCPARARGSPLRSALGARWRGRWFTLLSPSAARIPDVVPDGWIVLEVGHDQADAVAALLASASRQQEPGISGSSRCRRQATLCCGENTELSICPESPWILSAVRDRLRAVESSMHPAVAALRWQRWAGARTDAKQVGLLATRRPIVSTTDRSRETLMA